MAKNEAINIILWEVCAYQTMLIWRIVSIGTATRLRVTNEGIAPLYRDAWFAIGDICSATTLRGLLPGEERTIEIPAAVSPDGSSLHIVSSHILPEQEIEFEADIRK